MSERRRTSRTVWFILVLLLGILGAVFIPDIVRSHQLHRAVETALPGWRKAASDYALCVDSRLGDQGITAEGLFWTRLRDGSLSERLRGCGEKHLSDPLSWDESLRKGSIGDSLTGALSRLGRTWTARRRDHGPSLPGVDDRAVRGACERMQSVASALEAVEVALSVTSTMSPNDCKLTLPGLSGMRPPADAGDAQLLDLQVRDAHVVAQLRPKRGGTRFAVARLLPPTEQIESATVDWRVTAPMPALADGRDYAWDEKRGLWTVGFDPEAKRWRGYHWRTEWRPSAWLPLPYTPDRVDWAAPKQGPVLVARTGKTKTAVFRFDADQVRAGDALRQVERFDPMTHIGATGSVTTVDLEFPAAGPHLSASHQSAAKAEVVHAFVPLSDAQTQWFVQPHVVGCTHERRHWAVVGSRWLTPTDAGGDGRWWVFTSADDGATWRQVARTPKAWQLFSPVLACRGDTLVNVTVSRPKEDAHTVFVECSPDTCRAPQRIVEPPARHIALEWSDTGLSVLLAFRAHAARFGLRGTPLSVRPQGAYRRLPVRSAWDTIAHVDGKWFDLITVDPLPW